MLGLDYIKRASIAFQSIENTPLSVCGQIYQVRLCIDDRVFKRCDKIPNQFLIVSVFKVVLTFTYNLCLIRKLNKQANKNTQQHTQKSKQTSKQTNIQTTNCILLQYQP